MPAKPPPIDIGAAALVAVAVVVALSLATTASRDNVPTGRGTRDTPRTEVFWLNVVVAGSSDARAAP